jgi:hypothetical protein
MHHNCGQREQKVCFALRSRNSARVACFSLVMTDHPSHTVEGPELRSEIAQRLRRRRDEWSAAERAELVRGRLIAAAGALLVIVRR